MAFWQIFSAGFEISDENGIVLGKINIAPTEKWSETASALDVSEGVHSLFLTYKGSETVSLSEISFSR